MKYNREGFTLIELLVVIAIIGILSTIAMTSLNGARRKAKEAVVKTHMNNFKDAVVVAQQTQMDYLTKITNNTYSASTCLGGRDLRNVPESDPCYIAWMNVITKVEMATDGVITNLDSMKRDPWGSPYIVDENEGLDNGDPGDPCRHDLVFSAGVDGIADNGDDLYFDLPYAKCE